MKTLLSTLAVLGMLTGAALADDEPSESAEETENACAPADPCAELEGDAKTECEAKKAEAEKVEEAPPEEKQGKKMDKSNDNRMESYDSDE